MKLWPFQSETVEQIRDAIRQGGKRILLQAGTGSGKTVMMSHIMAEAEAKGSNVLFLAHRRELVHQCADKLERFGLDHISVLMAGVDYVWSNITVASVQTLWRRRNRMELPDADLLITDEAHHATAKTYRHLISLYPDAISLGMTATPARKDGQGLGDIYDTMVCAPSIADLTPDYLVPLKYVAPSAPDLDKVKILAGDYVANQLGSVMDKPTLIGDIVQHWLDFASDRQTLVFASSVKHSIHLSEKFREYGIDADHLDGQTPMEERDEIFARFRSGRCTVLVNCMVCTEGTDLPMCSCVILARPTKSLVLYYQMVGRVMRIYEGKTDGLVIDHTGSVYEHGFVDEPQPWALEKTSKIQERKAAAKRKSPKPVTCPECSAMFVSKPACPECGWKPERKGERIQEIDGQLVYVDRDMRAKEREVPIQERRDFYRSLVAIAKERGYKPGWVSHTYRKRYGRWPDRSWQGLGPTTPSMQARHFVQEQIYKWLREKNQQARA